MTVVRAAQYVRMSTEHQQYSTENQSDAIREYAQKHSMEIIRTFADAGKSGQPERDLGVVTAHPRARTAMDVAAPPPRT